jgi:hypothetical protein
MWLVRNRVCVSIAHDRAFHNGSVVQRAFIVCT